MNKKKLLKKLNYMPRWAWYLVSLSVAGPIGALGVYVGFHVLEKMAEEESEEEANAERQRRAAASAAHTYEDEDCVVSSDEEINRRWQQEKKKAAGAQQAGKPESPADEQPIDEDADVREVVRAGYAAMHRIRQANDIIADETLSAQIDSIENSCSQILSILEQRPQLLARLRTFLRYYLPTTLKLLEARAKLENSASTKKAREVRARISEAVGVIDKAFLKQVEALDAYRFIDLESEMDVLSDMLRQDGLLDEDEEEDPFAAVLGGH